MENPSSSTKRHRLKEKEAFEEFVAPSALASPPSSSTRSKLRWNVFIKQILALAFCFSITWPDHPKTNFNSWFWLSFIHCVSLVHFNSMDNPSSSTKRHRLKEKEAFEELVPPSALASPPSSSTQSRLRWNVFISHRGPDVKATLATAIYKELSSIGEQVFLDERALKPGDSIPAEIREAMNDAFLHVAIFSKGYADSPWCLAELSHMLTTGVKIIPIFYHVKPSELCRVDKGKTLYASSFDKHKSRYTEAKVGEWKEALETVSYRNGYEINNEDWGWVLKGLAKSVVMERSKGKLAVPTNALGLEERVEEIEKIIQRHKSERTYCGDLG